MSETETRWFAWALIPNHFHLLLKTGQVHVATVMRRLLTGYAIGFNRRHLFQNRYKSILCQQGAYLKELVCCIHINQCQAVGLTGKKSLGRHPYRGAGSQYGV